MEDLLHARVHRTRSVRRTERSFRVIVPEVYEARAIFFHGSTVPLRRSYPPGPKTRPEVWPERVRNPKNGRAPVPDETIVLYARTTLPPSAINI